ncbi:lactate utilization protein [Colwellia sp. 75C3]|uniref:LutC/YkgG family protein n=1 Tax=Colwellia sp. 75C3 TaxID=888425 RepID=UPI000C3476B0|nr:lactate utilization protein [Colwellia sp. 75C3]PKG85162.1 lactate utilization protein [Colwellia sp. 75C3]
MTNKSADINAISSKARGNILAKLKAEVSGADYDKLPEEIPYIYPEFSHEENLAQFISELEKNHAQVIQTTKEGIAEVISAELAALNITTLLCGEKCYGGNDVHRDVINGLDSNIELQPYDFSIDNNKELLFNECPAALSSSRCSIAATGTIVLWPDENEPRSLSLVPPVHFVIVDANKLHADFARLMAAEQWHDKLPTNVVLISGPSKTADIQQTLAYGAHGPKALIVLLLNS